MKRICIAGVLCLVVLPLARAVAVEEETGDYEALARAVGNDDLAALRADAEAGAALLQRADDGTTLLHLARSAEAATFLLDAGLDIGARNHLGRTPLHEAVLRNDAGVVGVLIERGADAQAGDISQSTPISVTRHAPIDTREAVRVLIDKAVLSREEPDRAGLERALSWAARNGDVPLVEALLAHEGLRAPPRQNIEGIAARAREEGHPETAEILDALAETLPPPQPGPPKGTWPEPSPLVKAVKAGDLTEVRRLIAEGAEVNKPGDSLFCPLTQALFEDRLDIAEVLIEAGANVNEADPGGATALHWMMQFGGAEGTVFLIQHGADHNAKDLGGWTPLGRWLDASTWYVLGIPPAEAGEADIVQVLMKLDADLTKPYHGSTTLVHVSYSLEATRYVIAQGGDVNARSRELGKTPLHFLAPNSDSMFVSLLVEAGARVNVWDQEGMTPLHRAVKAGRIETAAILLDNAANPNARAGREMTTPLQMAVRKEDKPLVELLLKHGADVNARDGRGNVPLLGALGGDGYEIAELLVASGADVNAVPLTSVRRTETAEFLIRHGARTDVRYKDDATALHKAVEWGGSGIVEILLREGIEVDARNKYARTPLHVAAGGGNLGAVKSLLEHGANPNARAEHKVTPLHAGARSGSPAVVRLLLEKGADVNAQADDGETPLHRAAECGDAAVLEVLLEAGAHPNALIGWSRYGPLHNAVKGGHDLAVQLLVEAGADVNAPNNQNVTPLALAESRGHAGIAQFLRSRGASLIGRALRLRVLDAQTGAPLAGAEASLKTTLGAHADRTDESGRCLVPVRPGPSHVYLTVSAPSYVPTLVTWRSGSGQREAEIPEQFTLELPRGTPIGGVLQDGEGRPIAGAKVFLTIPQSYNVAVQPAVERYAVTTDAEGRWRCDATPVDLRGLKIEPEHPGYVARESYNSQSADPRDLHEMTARLVMQKELSVEGVVLAPDGRPVEGAAVALGARGPRFHDPRVSTDGEGRFRHGGVERGPTLLTVQAEGYAPELMEVHVQGAMEPVEVRLAQGSILRGRVVDAQGGPISGARVSVSGWRGSRTLQWRAQTDADGRFEWRDAPADEVLFNVWAADRAGIDGRPLSASDDEHVLVLADALRIHGAVTDARTGEPIGELTAMPGWPGEDGGPPIWARSNARRFTDGRYEVKFVGQSPGRLVRVDAEGHLPGVSRVFADDEGEQVLDFALERGAGPTGTVRLPDGTPAAGAQIAVFSPGQWASIYNGELKSAREMLIVESDSDGRFSLPAQPGPYSLFVLHDAGWAEVSGEELAASSDITVEPWGRVEGVARVGADADAHAAVALQSESWYGYEPAGPADHGAEVLSDGQGRFVMERVVPGPYRVARRVNTGPRTWGYTHAVPIAVESGETVHVTVGGSGRPVVGRALVTGDAAGRVDWGYSSSSIRLKLPEIPHPEGFDEWPEERQKSWTDSWEASEEGRARRRASRNYPVIIEPDGSFRVEDIPAETYELRIRASEAPVRRPGISGKALGSVLKEFVVPEMPGGRSDEPLDLGEIELALP